MIFISYNRTVAEKFETSSAIYNVCPKITISLKDPFKKSYPSDDDMDAMNVIEDSFESYLEKNGGFHVGRVTLKGVRLIYGYLPNIPKECNPEYQDDSRFDKINLTFFLRL